MPAADAVAELVIRGVTLEGKPFRPTDWAERLCGGMAAFATITYRFLRGFARDNEVQVRHGRVAERTKLAELPRVGDTA